MNVYVNKTLFLSLQDFYFSRPWTFSSSWNDFHSQSCEHLSINRPTALAIVILGDYGRLLVKQLRLKSFSCSFQNDHGMNEDSTLQSTIGETFINIPLDLRRPILESSMVLCGGNSLFHGLPTRYESEQGTWVHDDCDPWHMRVMYKVYLYHIKYICNISCILVMYFYKA